MKKNIKEAKALVEAYKGLLRGSIELMNARNSMLDDPSKFASEKEARVDLLKSTTGFGGTDTCTLCKPVSKLLDGDKTYLACGECVWSYDGYEKDNVTPCVNENYKKLSDETTEQEFIDLLKERIALLEKRIEEADLFEDIDSLELKDFIEKLKKSRKKHGSAPFHSIHEALGVCHEELYEATVEIHANKIEEAADEMLDLAIAAFWGHKSFKKREK